METSLVKINFYKCGKKGKKISRYVETSDDLGGANYQLHFEGAAG